MLTRLLAAAALTAMAMPLAAQTPVDLAASAQRQLPALTQVYKHLHRTPELSRHEAQTSAFLAGELRKLGYTVTEHVGKYPDGTQADGIVAILENGSGPRLLIRTDMDALPVGLFSRDGKIPAVLYWLGAADPEKLAESRKSGVPLPGLHSALFAPEYAPAIVTGVTAMTATALALLKQ